MWPLRRAPVALPDDPEDWPDVDVLIPTYNEPLNVVRYTALARAEHRLAGGEAARVHPR